jgi:hypothetical protein
MGKGFGRLGASLGGANASSGMPAPPAGYRWEFVIDSSNSNQQVNDSANGNQPVVALKWSGN